nr:glycosyltransferase 61 family protein [Acetobacter oeni]
MVDFLPKLHLLSLAGISLKSVRILLPANMGPFGRDLLRALDIGDEQILLHDPEKETLRCRTLIVPTMLRRAGRCHPIFADAVATLNEMIDRTGAVPASPLRRIYIARDPRFGRRLLGGEQAETIATQHDFTAIRPEQLPITSQIALFRGAREILGSYGSALHASIFCRPGVKIAAIHGQLPHAFDALQSGIGERLGQPAGYIFGQSLPDDPESIGFEETAFRTCLAEQFSHPNFLKPVPPKPDMTKSPVNIALNRPATQSSISVWSAETTPEREAERGVNGIVDAKNWFQTKLEDQPWWQVDLGAQFTLYSIRIFNRTGTTDVMARVAALGIALSTDGITWRKIMGPADHGIFGGADGDPLIWQAADFRDPETGRQGDEITASLVKVFLESKDLLSLGQVQVYGTPAGTSTSSEPRQTGPLSGLLPDDVF